MSNDPVLIAYIVKARPGKKPLWVRIGVVFPHDRGAGLTLLLNALPIKFNGRIVMLEPRDEPDAIRDLPDAPSCGRAYRDGSS